MSIDPDDELLNALRSSHSSDSLGRLGALAREGRADAGSPLIAPPDHLWDRISAAIAEPAIATEREVSVVNDVADPPAPSSTANVASLPVRRGSARWLVAAAAAIGLVVGVTGTLLAQRDPSVNEVVVERATLKPLQTQGSGSAQLVRRGPATELDVDVQDLPSVRAGFYEVWLIDSKVERLVSLGPLRPDGHYEVPAGVDATQYPIVDISHEDLDGNPKHSGDSLLRGTLA